MDFEPEGGRPKDIRSLLQGGSSGIVEIWGIHVGPAPRMDRALRRFQYRVARRITRRHPRRRGCGNWYYPLLAAAIAEASFKEIGTYVTRRQNMVAQYIAAQTIMYLYEQSAWRPGVNLS